LCIDSQEIAFHVSQEVKLRIDEVYSLLYHAALIVVRTGWFAQSRSLNLERGERAQFDLQIRQCLDFDSRVPTRVADFDPEAFNQLDRPRHLGGKEVDYVAEYIMLAKQAVIIRVHQSVGRLAEFEPWNEASQGLSVD